MSKDQVLQSRVIKLEPVKWKELCFIQHNGFKELPTAARQRLKQSIIENKFSDPFKVWEDKSSGKIYCLDGKHRTLILEKFTTTDDNRKKETSAKGR